MKCLSHRTQERCLGACRPKSYSLWYVTILFSFKQTQTLSPFLPLSFSVCLYLPVTRPCSLSTSALFSLTKNGKFHRPELAKCLLSVWPACILKHLKSESSTHLQEPQTDGVLCGGKNFNYEEFKKTFKLKLQTTNMYCFFFRQNSQKGLCFLNFLWRFLLIVCQSIRFLSLLKP